MTDDSQEKELTVIDEKNEILFVEKLNKIYKLLKKDDKEQYTKTIHILEHFVNIPEFWSNRSNTIDFMNKKLDVIIKVDNINHIHDILVIIDAIIKGTEYLIKQDLNRTIKFKNHSEGQRLTALQNNQDDNQYLPCFIEIWKKEKAGITFDRKLALKYIYENCKRNWPIKFETFRKKYKCWDKTIPTDKKVEDMKSISCRFHNECVNLSKK